MDEQLYEIQDGVRRSNAACLCRHKTISAHIDGRGEVVDIPLRCLRSPKAAIEDSGSRGADWGVIYRATQRGANSTAHSYRSRYAPYTNCRCGGTSG